MRRHDHFRQCIKRTQHQTGKIVLADELVDPLRQILNTHVAIKIRIFCIQIRQHILHAQIEIVRAFKFGQSTQQSHCPGFIDTNTEEKQQIVRPGFLHHHAALIKEFRHQRGGDPLVTHLPLLVHTGRQDRDFYRIEEHMVIVGIGKSVPVFTGCHRPARGFINLFRLPDIKEPTVRLFT